VAAAVTTRCRDYLSQVHNQNREYLRDEQRSQPRGPQRGSRVGVERRGPQRGSRVGVEEGCPARESCREPRGRDTSIARPGRFLIAMSLS
jgi:hypothetical protein